jgi:hypothetical protein
VRRRPPPNITSIMIEKGNPWLWNFFFCQWSLFLRSPAMAALHSRRSLTLPSPRKILSCRGRSAVASQSKLHLNSTPSLRLLIDWFLTWPSTLFKSYSSITRRRGWAQVSCNYTYLLLQNSSCCDSRSVAFLVGFCNWFLVCTHGSYGAAV